MREDSSTDSPQEATYIQSRAFSSSENRALRDHSGGNPEENQVLAHPFVSIAIIVYNEKSTIERCLSSIANQDYPIGKYEVVVVDGGSTDGTLDSIRKFPFKVVFEKRRCRGTARNTAVRNCRGEIIVFTDADCVVSETWLKDHVRLHRDPGIMAVGGAVLHGGDSSLPARVYHMIEFATQSPLATRRQSWEIATCNASFKSSAFQQVGPFPEIDWSEDCLLCWRVLRAGLSVVVDSRPRVQHMHQPMSFRVMFGKTWKQGYRDRELQECFGDDAPYYLPRRFMVALLLAPSLALARMVRYFTKLQSGTSGKGEILLWAPILLCASIFWVHGYLTATYGWREKSGSSP